MFIGKVTSVTSDYPTITILTEDETFDWHVNDRASILRDGVIEMIFAGGLAIGDKIISITPNYEINTQMSLF